MGATLSEVAFEYKALWLQAGFYFLTTCWVYRWQILMSRNHAIERYKELKEKENLSKQINTIHNKNLLRNAARRSCAGQYHQSLSIFPPKFQKTGNIFFELFICRCV